MDRICYGLLIAPLLLVGAAWHSGGEGVARFGDVSKKLLDNGLVEGEARAMLVELTTAAPHRLSGSAGAARAVALMKSVMEKRGLDNVHLEHVMVPHWDRGTVEKAVILPSAKHRSVELEVCALGGSIGTPGEGIEAPVAEVRSFEELKSLGDSAKGKIIFYNRPMDPSKLYTFEAYGGAVDQRSRGAIEAAKMGGVAALVRSMTLAHDDVPHTGAMGYISGVQKVPGAAVSTIGADALDGLLRRDGEVVLQLTLDCRTLADEPSANVVGEITGSEKPNEVIVVSGHLDCWDKGMGAHDDGSGCVQAIEALNLLKRCGIRPKRTIRAVLFMNEENGGRGAQAYVAAPERARERQIAAIESDAGGFAPRGISVQADSTVLTKVLQWKQLFAALDACKIQKGGSGADVSALADKGTPSFGLMVENHRYFDYHHSDNDTIDKVNERELEMGAIVEALFCYLVSEEGL